MDYQLVEGKEDPAFHSNEVAGKVGLNVVASTTPVDTLDNSHRGDFDDGSVGYYGHDINTVNLVTSTKSSNIDGDSLYFANAKKVYSEGNYRLCLVLLKHVKQTDNEYVSLFASCAYDLWKSEIDHIKNNSGTDANADGSNGDYDVFVCSKEVLDIVLSAFTFLLGNPNCTPYITYLHYLRLSQIYLSQNALRGALSIMQLASSRGYLENVLIVVQSWSIMTRTGSKFKETDDVLTFLVSAIVHEERENRRHHISNHIYVLNTDFPIYYLYLISTNHMTYELKTKVTMTEKQKKQHRISIEAMMAEGYALCTDKLPDNNYVVLKWFNDYNTWLDAGNQLQSSPYLLLAEDFYLESWKRNPLSNDIPHMIATHMKRYKRDDTMIKRVFEQAYYNISISNVCCRNMLVSLDHIDAMDGYSWNDRFIEQEKKVRKLQSLAKCFLLKLHWTELKKRFVARKEYFVAIMSIADRKFQLHSDTDLRHRIRYWRRKSIEIRETKYACACIIQSVWRRKQVRMWYVWAVYRVQRANYYYVNACQVVHNVRRQVFMKKWRTLTVKRRNDRAAYVISTTIMINGRSKRYYSAMERWMVCIRIQRKHSNRKSLRNWMKMYRLRYRKHARISIRFWVRDTLTRIEDNSIEKRLGVKEAVCRQMVSMFRAGALRVMWCMWQIEMKRAHVYHSKVKVTQLLRILYNRMVQRKRVTRKRVMLERVLAIKMRLFYRCVGRYFHYMYHELHVRRIQRFMRCCIARKKVHQMRRIHAHRRKAMHDRVRRVIRVNIPKYIYLLHRDRARAAMKIKSFFARLVIRTRAYTSVVRKKHTVDMIYTIHRLFLKCKLKQLIDSVRYSSMVGNIERMVTRIRMYHTYSVMWRWKAFTQYQEGLTAVYRLLVLKRIASVYWADAGNAITIQRNCATLMSSINISNGVYYNGYYQWEHPTQQRRKTLITARSMQQGKAMLVWMASYRLKYRHKKLAVAHIIPQCVDSYISKCIERQVMGHKIVYAAMIRIAEQKLYAMYAKARREREIVTRIHMRPLLVAFQSMHTAASARYRSRYALQCWCRCVIAVRKCHRLRQYYANMATAARIVSSSSLQRLKVKEIMRVLQVMFCVSRASGRSLVEMKAKRSSSMTTASSIHHSDSYYYDSHTDKHQHRQQQRHQQQHQQQRLHKSIPRQALARRHTVNADGTIALPLRSTTNRLTTLSLSSKQQLKKMYRTASSNGIDEFDLHIPSTDSTADLKVISHSSSSSSSVPDFYSQEFNSHLFRIKQSGIFIFDTHTATLTLNELHWCIQSASTIFLQGVTSSSMKEILQHFNGYKLVCCGGSFHDNDTLSLYQYMLSISSSSHAINSSNDISIHFSDTKLSFLSLAYLFDKLRALPPSPSLCGGISCITNLRELSVDTASCGSLSIGLLLAMLKDNCCVEVLIIKFAKSVSLQSYGGCIRHMSSNKHLKELRMFGGSFGDHILRGLLYSVSNGLSALEILEFNASSSPISTSLSEAIIDSAKRRLLQGNSSGLSVQVTVD